MERRHTQDDLNESGTPWPRSTTSNAPTNAAPVYAENQYDAVRRRRAADR